MVSGCPNYWSPSMILRSFRDLILHTWTTEEILHVQALTTLDALPRRETDTALEGAPLLHKLRKTSLYRDPGA